MENTEKATEDIFRETWIWRCCSLHCRVTASWTISLKQMEKENNFNKQHNRGIRTRFVKQPWIKFLKKRWDLSWLLIQNLKWPSFGSIWRFKGTSYTSRTSINYISNHSPWQWASDCQVHLNIQPRLCHCPACCLKMLGLAR